MKVGIQSTVALMISLVLLTMATALLALYVLQGKAIGAPQGVPAISEAHNDTYTARLLQQEGVGYKTDQTPTWTFAVTNKETHNEAVLQMENETDEIEELALVNDVLVVLGSNRYSAQTATLFDLPTRQQKDFIWGYKLGLSATKRYLICDQFYPRFADEGATSDVILLYDLSKSPLENRIGPEAQKLAAWAGEVGYPIFPEENVHKQSYREWIEDEQDLHSAIPWGKYLWLEDDKQVVFIDRHHGTDWLVLVDLSQGLTKVEIRKKLIDVTGAIDVTTMMALDHIADAETALREGKARIPIVGLRQSTEGKIVISIKPDMRYKATEIEMALP